MGAARLLRFHRPRVRARDAAVLQPRALMGKRGTRRGHSRHPLAMAAAVRFIAHSRTMRGLVLQLRRFARTDSNVLVTGETGVGKNAVAHELHARGPRAGRPFVTIDCASLSATLIDSELFGHERGAFTDAVTARAGRFELAGDGTVYLDAVTDLSIEAQGKLLRMVEDKRVERLGGHVAFTVGARIIASAQGDIEE